MIKGAFSICQCGAETSYIIQQRQGPSHLNNQSVNNWQGVTSVVASLTFSPTNWVPVCWSAVCSSRRATVGSRSVVPPAASPSCLSLRLSETCSSWTGLNQRWLKKQNQQNLGPTLRLKLTERHDMYILEGQTPSRQHSASGVHWWHHSPVSLKRNPEEERGCSVACLEESTRWQIINVRFDSNEAQRDGLLLSLCVIRLRSGLFTAVILSKAGANKQILWRFTGCLQGRNIAVRNPAAAQCRGDSCEEKSWIVQYARI